MIPPVDTTHFQLGVSPDGDPDEEGPMLAELKERAHEYLEIQDWAPPIKEMLLAFGIGWVIGVYLVRFEEPVYSGPSRGDLEHWIIVGDMPSISFDTMDATTPGDALRLYCTLCEDWAARILADDSLEDSYPITAAPTEEHARMLLSRVDHLLRVFVPMADALIPSTP